MRLLVSAGGTGGGVYPALAVVAALGEGCETLWVGGEGGLEADLVRRAGVPFAAIPAAGVHGVGVRALPSNLWRVGRGIVRAYRLIRRYQPDVLLFTGGYVGVPVALAGWRLPKVLFVPDVEPGLGARVISKLANVIATTCKPAVDYFPRHPRVVVTGYPTRPELRPMERALARQALGLKAAPDVLLVFGGSLGARSINQALWQGLTEVLPHAQVLHITGERDWPEVEPIRRSLPSSLAGSYYPHPYLHETMSLALSAADLAVSRAGASALGEYPLFGLPSVLVPYPHAWRYQRLNAQHLVAHGAALMLSDAEVAEKLLPTVLELLADPERRENMALAARKLARPSAAQDIAAQVKLAARKGNGAHG